MLLKTRDVELGSDFCSEHADTFRRDFHPDLRAGYARLN